MTTPHKQNVPPRGAGQAPPKPSQTTSVAATSSVTGGRLRFAAGEMLFHQGDAGGDLFFIEEGTVEIYQIRDHETIPLSEMRAGEIIGVMTCMTREQRMASARAKTTVLCKRVPQDAISKVLQALPNWLKIIIKEFTIRLNQMNRMYTDAALKIRKLEATQISDVYLGALIACSFATTSELMATPTDIGKIVVIEDVLQKLEFMLNMRREDIDRIWQCLVESNLIKIELESDKKREIAMLENARKLAYFGQFVKDSKTGSSKRYVRARFSNKETRVLSALVKYAQRMSLDIDKVCRLRCRDLERSLERNTGVTWDREALNKGVELELLRIEASGEDEIILCRLRELGRTVACVEAMRRLSELESRTGREEAVDAKPAA